MKVDAKKKLYKRKGFVQHKLFDNGEQVIFEFKNGYGASVLTGKVAYGGINGLFEIAVTRNGYLCYDTPITNDVIGYLTIDELLKLLDDIERLPDAPK
ncbi:MAG: hypothetical protein E6458_00750 [Veillonella sp.]|nr:hypothetical protein [Veillonella sp.]